MLRKICLLLIVLLIVPYISSAETIDVLIKGMDDGIKSNKQQDYNEAVMNAKLQAIERAGVEIESITRVVNFQTKFDMVESKAKGILQPGFQIMDLGYQVDGTYQVALSGKISTEAPGSGKNLEAQEKLDDLKIKLSKRRYSIEKQISYYKAFINDWSGTPAVEEARLIVDKLQELQREKEKRKEQQELLRKTGIRLNCVFRGSVSKPIQYKPNWHSTSYLHYSAICTVRIPQISGFNETWETDTWHKEKDHRIPDQSVEKRSLQPQQVTLEITYGIMEKPLQGSRRWKKKYTGSLKVLINSGQMTNVTIVVPVYGLDLGEPTVKME